MGADVAMCKNGMTIASKILIKVETSRTKPDSSPKFKCRRPARWKMFSKTRTGTTTAQLIPRPSDADNK